MENLLAKPIVITAFTQLGISLHGIQSCHSRGNMQMIEMNDPCGVENVSLIRRTEALRIKLRIVNNNETLQFYRAFLHAPRALG